MSIQEFWPSEQNVNDCIKSEAETIDPAVFFAVHQPMTFKRRPSVGAGAPVQRTEGQLLQDFLSDRNTESGYLMVPIIGSSGVGKSHVIRWLDERIKSSGSDRGRHIIRIPKSASFRQALDLILKDLHGPVYAEIRRLLKAAHDRLEETPAVVNLRAKLEITCRQEAEGLRSRLAHDDYPDHVTKEADKLRLSHLQLLPAFLNDAEICGHLERGVLGRIARRVVGGWHPGIEDEVFQFSESDVDLSQVDLHKTGGAARNYCTILNTSSGRGHCVKILNQMVDSAVRQLFDLGAMSLHDVFLQVRASLAKEHKELILLIEDFASLTGVQAELIDGIIATSTDNALCVVRTALAVTEGYEGYLNRDTVRTRAKFEWMIENIPYADRADALGHILDIVGAYLNAARYGRKALHALYTKARASSEWLPDYSQHAGADQETMKRIEAFGACSKGHSIFPFNRQALERLAEKYLSRGNQIEFHPRSIINYILRETLAQRTSFIRGDFPPEDFHGLAAAQSGLGAEILPRLQRGHPAAMNRYVSFLAHWGGTPASWDAVTRIDSRLYEAFGLPPLVAGVVAAPDAPDVKDSSTQVTPPVADAEPKAVAEIRRAIQHWRAGQALSFRNANTLRSYLWQALKEYVDWDLQLIKLRESDTYYSTWIYIPRAAGGATTCSADQAIATICTDEEMGNAARAAEIELELTALARRSEQKNWSYPQADADMPLYLNLLERLHGQAVQFITTRLFRANYDAVPALVDTLAKGARICNLEGAFSNARADRVNAIFQGTADAVPQPQPETTWGDIRCEAVANREKLKEQLLLAVGARQSGAAVVYAVDAARLLAVEGNVQADVPADLSDLRASMRSFRQLGKVHQESRNRLGPWVKAFDDAFGSALSKDEFIEVMREAITKSATDYRNRTGVEKSQVRDALTTFKDAPVMEQYNLAREFLEADKEDQWLRALARLDDAVLGKVAKVIALVSGFLSETSKHVAAEIDGHGTDGGFGVVEANIRSVLQELIGDCTRYQGIKNHDAN